MVEKRSFYITTPIYYVNDAPHVGHAYTTLACDVLARFKRLDGFDVKFITGTDEHGQKVEKSAQKAGIDPQTFTDKVSENFQILTRKMNFTNDDFIRTTEQRHKIACQDIWRRLIDAGDIYLGSYAGFYSVRDEAFYAESELINNDKGEKIAPTGAEVEWLEEPSYFFKLSAWQERLLAFYKKNPEFILPLTRRNEVTSFVEGGLQDLSVSRTSFKWGVPVPNDDKHIMYVWLDALTNYITAIGYPDTAHEEYEKFWPADVHMVGKDILRFHAVYWPAFLMAAGLEPPKRIFAHGWWLMGESKMSKSLGNVINPMDLIDDYGVDPVRYYLMREMVLGQDSSFTMESFIQRYNSDLANDFGNLLSRVSTLMKKNYDGKIPEPGDFTEAETVIKSNGESLGEVVKEKIESMRLNEAIEEIMQYIRSVNKYMENNAPWKLVKEDKDAAGRVLYTAGEALRIGAVLLSPVMPNRTAILLDVLNAKGTNSSWGGLTPGNELKNHEPLFPRMN